MLHIEIAADLLQRAVGRAMGVIEKKSSMPILSSVLLEAERTPEGGRLSVSAYDLEIAVRSSCPVELKETGAICLNAERLFAIASQAPESVVSIKVGARNRTTIESGRMKATLVAMDAAEFPGLPPTPSAAFDKVSPGILAKLFAETRHAICTDLTRYNLNGIYLEADGAVLKATATDGHRLAHQSVATDGKWGKHGLIIPEKAIDALARLFKESTETPTEISITPERFDLRRDGMTFTARGIAAAYVDYLQVISPDDAWGVELSRARLLESVKRLKTVVEDGATVTLTGANGLLSLQSSDADRGEIAEEIAADVPAMKVGVNSRYLADALESMSADIVRLGGADTLSPITLTVPGSRDPYRTVMPIRID